jgi:ABC-type bacteriocin/lantibiotic exporter with double-glycine peptidase domain
MRFPNGYDTVIDEKNMNLSGGEKQLISLARALLKDYDVLILDEVNSAVDVDTEIIMMQNLPKYFKNKIVFIISHKKNMLQLCNKEIVLSHMELTNPINTPRISKYS